MFLLDEALINRDTLTKSGVEAQRQQVLQVLQSMGKTASTLIEGETGGNHPFIQDNMQDFVLQLTKLKLLSLCKNQIITMPIKSLGGAQIVTR